MRLRLIDDIRHAPKFASLHVSGAMALLCGAGPALFDAWSRLPDDLKASLPHGWARVIATGGFLLVMLARVVQIDDTVKESAHAAQ
jgi:hypothetical protein